MKSNFKTNSKTLCLFIAIIFSILSFQLEAQTPNFTWIGGTNLASQSGNYGTKGITAPTNIPGAKAEAMSWTDNTGNFWLFGGGMAGHTNDLWKYNVATGLWTWMHGSSSASQVGIYGTLGVPTASTTPGARKSGVTWVDNAGNLWLFGGMGYASAGPTGFMNDLWKYDIGTNMWTWISGSNVKDQVGNYGTKGVTAPTNMPPSRFLSMGWKDNTGNLWLFGGSGATGITQDLWKYDIGLNQWTWISGTTLAAQNGNYGTKGVLASTNIPGGRCLSRAWKDNTGNFWLFGGSGFDISVTSQTVLGDLWKYNMATNEWVWMNGNSAGNQVGSYGTKGVSAPANHVGSRTSSQAWTDAAGNFWLFGGLGFGSTTLFNDLWKYNVTTNEWTWIAGTNLTNQFASYGTINVQNTANIPGGRDLGATWRDNLGYLYLFGGAAYLTSGFPDYVNDLWKIDPTGLATAIDSNVESSPRVNTYPNPNNGEFFIQGNANEVLTVTNELGQIITTLELSVTENYRAKLNLKESGIYFISGKELKQKVVVIK